MFVDLHTKFPNMVTGVLSRNSIRRALNCGITAQQLVEYMTAHAHPEMGVAGTAGGPTVPATVVDQILLWEAEKNRLVMTEGVWLLLFGHRTCMLTRIVRQLHPGYLYQGFLTQEEYSLALQYAQGMGIVAWSDDTSRNLFIRGPEGHAMLKGFLQRRARAMPTASAAAVPAS
jgi:transcription initiation factor TFIIH subunit 4